MTANSSHHSHADHDHANHDHSHDHHHGIGHHHHGNASSKVLLIAVAMTLIFAAVEAIGGWWAHSLVLLSDAGHMASDSLALGIAAFAAWIANRPPSDQHSYGYGRAEIIGAWISSLLMVVVVVAIIVEAIERIHNPAPVVGGMVMIIATIGIIVNLSLAWVLSRGEQTMNIRAAVIHVIGDLLGSLAALISGAVIYFKHWTMIDPILSIFVSLLILFSSLQLLRESLVILMEGVPKHLDLNSVGEAMSKIAKVLTVHDLHIWTLSSGKIMLSAHVEIDDFNDWPAALKELRHLLESDYGISHVTLQPESKTERLQAMPYKPGCNTQNC